MSKFTPGPWTVAIEEEGESYREISIPEISRIIHSSEWASIEEYEQDEANARLISAAPEMYEALNDLLDCISETRGKDAYKAQRKAIDALAKADGKA